MGSDNVRLIYGRWGHLPDPSFRLLTYMGLVTRDDDDPPEFWQGRTAMALALGRLTPDEPALSDRSARAEEFRRARESDFRAVKRALTPLFKTAVVSILQRPGPGQQAKYGLHLDTPNGGRFAAPTGDVSRSNGGHETSNQVPQNVPRDGGIKGGQVSTKDFNNFKPTNTSPQVSTSLGAVDNDDIEAELNYQNARAVLEKLPDLGQGIISGLTHIEGMRNRVIAAAGISIERSRSEAS